MAQQTAVEWLVSQQKHNKLFDIETIEQAKAMEREQIIDSYSREQIIDSYSFGYANGFDDANLPIPIRIDDSEQYYNETFKK